MLDREGRRLATAATFLTRLPWVARWASGAPAELAHSVRYFPLIGALIGLLVGAVFYSLSALLPATLSAILALTIGVLLTGAFHEDGLADTADGLGGSFERARKLEIMRDSRLGTYGTLALILLMLAKVSALAALAPASAIGALVAAHSLARFSSLPLIIWLPYVREGSHKPLAEGVGMPDLLIAFSLTVVLLICSVGLSNTLLLLALSGLVVALSGRYFKQQLGGITGDCLGASNQLTELTVLIALCALQKPS